jgi:hypothetical protein
VSPGFRETRAISDPDVLRISRVLLIFFLRPRHPSEGVEEFVA